MLQHCTHRHSLPPAHSPRSVEFCKPFAAIAALLPVSSVNIDLKSIHLPLRQCLILYGPSSQLEVFISPENFSQNFPLAPWIAVMLLSRALQNFKRFALHVQGKQSPNPVCIASFDFKEETQILNSFSVRSLIKWQPVGRVGRTAFSTIFRTLSSLELLERATQTECLLN